MTVLRQEINQGMVDRIKRSQRKLYQTLSRSFQVLLMEGSCEYWWKKCNHTTDRLLSRRSSYGGLALTQKLYFNGMKLSPSTEYRPNRWRLSILDVVRLFYLILLIISNNGSVRAELPFSGSDSTDIKVNVGLSNEAKQVDDYPRQEVGDVVAGHFETLVTCKETEYYDAVIDQCQSCAHVCGPSSIHFCRNNCPEFYEKHVHDLNPTYIKTTQNSTDVPNDSAIYRFKHGGTEIRIYKQPSINSRSTTMPSMIILPQHIPPRKPVEEELSGLDRFIDKPLFWTTMVSLILAISSMTTIVILCIQRRRAAILASMRAGQRHRRVRRRRILRWRGRKRDGRRDAENGAKGEGDIEATVECLADTLDEKCRMLSDTNSSDKTQRDGAAFLPQKTRPLVIFQSSLKASNPPRPRQSNLNTNDMTTLVPDWSLSPNQNVRPHDCHSPGLVDESWNVFDVFPDAVYARNHELPLYSISARMSHTKSYEFDKKLSERNLTDSVMSYQRSGEVLPDLSGPYLTRLNKFKPLSYHSMRSGKYPSCFTGSELISSNLNVHECHKSSEFSPQSSEQFGSDGKNVSSNLDVRMCGQSTLPPLFVNTIKDDEQVAQNIPAISGIDAEISVLESSCSTIADSAILQTDSTPRVGRLAFSSSNEVTRSRDIPISQYSIPNLQNSTSNPQDSTSEKIYSVYPPTSVSQGDDSLFSPCASDSGHQGSITDLLEFTPNPVFPISSSGVPMPCNSFEHMSLYSSESVCESKSSLSISPSCKNKADKEQLESVINEEENMDDTGLMRACRIKGALASRVNDTGYDSIESPVSIE